MSKNYDKDDLGTRMKQYEQPTTGRKAFKGQPLVARLDGKSFHTFTKGLKRPYDERLSNLMVAFPQSTNVIPLHGAHIIRRWQQHKTT